MKVTYTQPMEVENATNTYQKTHANGVKKVGKILINLIFDIVEDY